MSWITHPWNEQFEYHLREQEGIWELRVKGVLSRNPILFFSLFDMNQWVADRSNSPDHYPLGDLVHSATDFLGIERCDACARKQAALNRLVKKGKLGRLLAKVIGKKRHG